MLVAPAATPHEFVSMVAGNHNNCIVDIVRGFEIFNQLPDTPVNMKAIQVIQTTIAKDQCMAGNRQQDASRCRNIFPAL
jgi:hypothetical protein